MTGQPAPLRPGRLELARRPDRRPLVAGDDRVLGAGTLEEMSHVRAMVDNAGWTVAWGTGLELYRRGENVFVGHGGAMPGYGPVHIFA